MWDATPEITRAVTINLQERSKTLSLPKLLTCPKCKNRQGVFYGDEPSFRRLNEINPYSVGLVYAAWSTASAQANTIKNLCGEIQNTISGADAALAKLVLLKPE